MTVRHGVIGALLRAYPRTWRGEYGEELAGILARKRLTLRAIANVIGNGALQRLYGEDPWKICGAGLALWTCLGLVLSTDSRLAPSVARWCSLAPLPVLFATGAWTVLRKKAGSHEAGVAAAKAAVFCFFPEVLAALMRGPTVVWHADGTVWRQWGLYYATTLRISPWQYGQDYPLIVMAGSVLLGFGGALLGRFIVGLGEGLRAA